MIGSTIFYQQKKQPFAAKLSLVSLMDIFTILVFFLLLNSGESQEIENAKFVELPDSSSGVAPHTDLRITVADDEILLGDRVVALVADVTDSPERIIEPLAEALSANTEKRGELSDYERDVGLAVTVMGDRSVPYSLLRKVMTTCQNSNYRNISLAVNRVNVEQATDILPASLEVEKPEDATTTAAVRVDREG